MLSGFIIYVFLLFMTRPFLSMNRFLKSLASPGNIQVLGKNAYLSGKALFIFIRFLARKFFLVIWSIPGN